MQPDLPWLANKRFWIVAIGLFVFACGYFLVRRIRLGVAEPSVPVVALSGPNVGVPGEHARYTVLVRDRHGAAWPHSSVRIGIEDENDRFTELASGETNDSGEASLDIKYPEKPKFHWGFRAIASGGVTEGHGYLAVEPKSLGATTTIVTTDKPLYQPGQTIHIRALAMQGEKPVIERPCVVEIRVDGIKVFREEKKTSAFGVLAVDFELADQVRLGAYGISITTQPLKKDDPNDPPSPAYRVVNVQRYSLPKLKLVLEETAPFQGSEPLRGTARATWIFGEPVTKGTVTMSLEDGSGTLHRSQTGALDKEGRFRFALPVAPGKSSQGKGWFNLKARLAVEGGLSAEASKGITTSDAAIRMEIFPESGVLVPGVEQTVFVVVDYPNPKGLRVDLHANSKELGFVDDRGIARVTFTPAEGWNELDIPGPLGSGGSARLEASKNGLVIRPDKEAYASGESTRIRLAGGEAGDRIAVRLTKNGGSVASGTCVTQDRVCEVTLAIPPTVSGLVWVHALAMPSNKDHEIRVGKRLIVVDGGSRDVTVDVKPDKPVYAPRDIGTLTIAAKGAGGGATKAQLAISVADEAVFALADVRPDLERRFFVIEDDLVRARSSRSSSTVHMPTGLERDRAWERDAPPNVRAATLAVLSTMEASGAIEDAKKEDLERAIKRTVSEAQNRSRAWAIVMLIAFAFAGFIAFAIYGVMRLRRPIPSTATELELAAFKIETRGLLVDWLALVLGPPILGVFAILFGELFAGYSGREENTILGAWSALTILAVVPLSRAVMRVRKTQVAQEAPLFRRVLTLLPPATFLGQLAILCVVGDSGSRLRVLFDRKESVLFIPLFIAIVAQLTFGLLSVIRQSFLRELSWKTRVWLFLSRASFIGLPVSIVLGVLLVRYVKRDRSLDGEEREPMPDVAADNKEGGTGTRAKGEEGSMGNPSTGRFALAAPKEEKAAAGVASPVRVRDYFPETLLWAPEVITDDQGKASLKVPFADSITTWRMNVLAVTATGQLGSTSVPLVVKQDFFVEAALPPTLTQSDEVGLPITVFSYLPNAQDVSVELEGEGMTVVGQKQATVHLEPKEARGMRFVVRAEKAGERVVRVKATSGAHGDAQERKVLVTPNGQPIVKTINGRVSGSGSASTELPGNAIDGGNDLHVKVYGGPMSQVTEGLDGVFHAPYGCFEQTSSTTYPSVLVLDFLQRMKAVRPEVSAKARRYIVQGQQRLVSFEVNGGGFSLFGSDPADTALTAYGLLEFSDMAKVASVDEGVVSRARSFLLGKRLPSGMWGKRYFDKWNRPNETEDLVLTAYVAWSLAAAKDDRVKEVLDVVEKMNGADAEDPYALALRANALMVGGRVGQAKPLLEKLATQAVRDDEGVHWTSKASGVLYSYGSSFDIEVTGLSSHALAQAELHPELRNGALDWLVRRRNPHGTWSTTQATIAAMRALLDEAKPASPNPQEITVLVDGQPASTFVLEPNARDVHRLIDLKRFATTGKHAVEIKATGEGDVSYQLVTTHWLPWRAPEKKGLSLEVQYTPASIPAGGTMTARVHLAWKGEKAAMMPLVEIGVPPAFDVETDDLEQQRKSNRIQRYIVERGKVTLYLTSLVEQSPLHFDLRLRASRSARVVAPASVAYLYYEPEVRTETAPVVVRAQ